MNKIFLLAIIGVSAIALIAAIVVFQFIQQQSDRQAAIDTVTDLMTDKPTPLQEEFKAKLDMYIKEAAEKCPSSDNINTTTPEQQKCYEDLIDKYGLLDEKYDEFR
jgi:antitoxin component HigA of HigAB toxin-antitoxin module